MLDQNEERLEGRGLPEPGDGVVGGEVGHPALQQRNLPGINLVIYIVIHRRTNTTLAPSLSPRSHSLFLNFILNT